MKEVPDENDPEILAALRDLVRAMRSRGLRSMVRVETRLGSESFVHVTGGTAAAPINEWRVGSDVLATLRAWTAEYAARVPS